MWAAVVPDNVDRLRRPPTLAGMVIALLVVPLLGGLDLIESQLLGDALKWALAGSLVFICVRLESEPLASIGAVRPRWIDVGWALVLVVGTAAVFVFTGPLIEALGLATQQGIAQPTLVYGVFSAITAGVTEEILFRGYPIERLIDAGYSPILGGAITWALFTLAHLGAGYPGGTLVQIGLAAFVITAIYVHVRSLFPVILGHVLVDIVGVWAFFFA